MTVGLVLHCLLEKIIAPTCTRHGSRYNLPHTHTCVVATLSQLSSDGMWFGHLCPCSVPTTAHPADLANIMRVCLIILQLDELIQWLHVFRNSSIHIEFHSGSKNLHCVCVSFNWKLLLFQLFLQSMETYQELLQSQSYEWALFSPVQSREEGNVHIINNWSCQFSKIQNLL